MIVGDFAGFCDLHIHFQVGVKNHTQVSHWRHRCDLILTHMNEWYVYAFELLFTSYNQEFCLAVIHDKHVGNHPAPQFCHTIFNGSDWGCLIRGRNGSEWQVNLMVIDIALGFWEVLFYDLEKVGNIDGEQHRAKAWSLWYWVLWERYDVNHFKAVPPTPKPEPKVSNKILWSIVSNAVLRSSMTRRVTFWSSMNIRLYLQKCRLCAVEWSISWWL